jgi:hypothetical protein
MVRNVGWCALQVCLVSRRVSEPPEFVYWPAFLIKKNRLFFCMCILHIDY